MPAECQKFCGLFCFIHFVCLKGVAAFSSAPCSLKNQVRSVRWYIGQSASAFPLSVPWYLGGRSISRIFGQFPDSLHLFYNLVQCAIYLHIYQLVQYGIHIMIKSILSSMAHITSESAGYQLKNGWGK